MKRQPVRRALRLETLETRALLSGTQPLVSSSTPFTKEIFLNYAEFYATELGAETLTLKVGSDPSSTRTAFDQVTGVAINQLSTAINSDISTLPPSTISALTPVIAAELTGTSGNSLTSELKAIQTPATNGSADLKLFNSQILEEVEASAELIAGEVALVVPANPPPTGNAAIQAEASAALALFKAQYTGAISAVLYAPSMTGAINPAINRIAFNSVIASDLTTLQTTLTSAVSMLSDASTLDTDITTDLTSLKSELLGVATPTGAYTPSAAAFQKNSSLIIAATTSTLTTLIDGAAPLG